MRHPGALQIRQMLVALGLAFSMTCSGSDALLENPELRPPSPGFDFWELPPFKSGDIFNHEFDHRAQELLSLGNLAEQAPESWQNVLLTDLADAADINYPYHSEPRLWDMLKARPFAIEQQQRLRACAHPPRCFVEQAASRFCPANSGQVLIYYNGKGVQLVQTRKKSRGMQKKPELCRRGYIDAPRKTWIGFGGPDRFQSGSVGFKSIVYSVDSLANSSLLSICSRPDFTSTSGGYRTSFVDCLLLDLEKRMLVLKAKQSIDLLADNEVRVPVHAYSVIGFPCPGLQVERPMPTKSAVISRQGPTFRAHLNIDISTWPPHITDVSPIYRWSWRSGSLFFDFCR